MRLGKGTTFSGQAVDPNQLVSNRSRITTTTYWAGNQGQIYIGPYLIDEVVGCGYKINQSKIPIYGYNSQYFDAVADGKILVSGWFTINYIDSGYMYAAMNKYISDIVARKFDSRYDFISGDGIFHPVSEFPDTEFKKILEELRANEQDPSKGNPWGSPNITLMKKVGQAIGENSASKDALITMLRNKFWGQDTNDRSLGSNQSKSQIKGMSDKFEKGLENFDSIDASSFLRPDQMPAISLTIAHGDPLDHNTSTFRVITDLHILSCEQNVHITDDPQTETYTFIARSISY